MNPLDPLTPYFLTPVPKTKLRAGLQGFDSQQGANISLFAAAFTLYSTSYIIGNGGLLPEGNAAGREARLLLLLVLRMHGVTPAFPRHVHGVVLTQAPWELFQLTVYIQDESKYV